ncbi:bacterio-opsin activator domain-containing protein [Halovenus sp. HT40]|uniref:bacterio-opsin activator domain-containing protein n=1 Tax=Halovenus sp. HT40 TaxID=3126691 RepID=UPI00300E86FE
MKDRYDAAPIGILETTTDGVVTGANRSAKRLLDQEQPRECHLDDVFPQSVENTVPAVFERSEPESREVEEYYPELDRWFDITVVPAEDEVTIYLQDVTDRYHDRQRIEQLRGDIDRLTVTNGLISDILGTLVDASSREEIAATICERLGETDLYEFAWVGERELGGEEIQVQASSGTPGRTLEAIEEILDTGTPLPEQQAIETATPEIVQPLGEDESVPEPIRRAAFADGLQSLLAIPLTYGSNVYGVVGIYAANQEAFSQRERASFETVGEMAGFAINASRQRNLIQSDTVVELTIEFIDSDAPLVSVATATGSRLVLDGLVGQGGDLYCYLIVEDSEPEPVADQLADAPEARESRVISATETGGSLEVDLTPETPLGTLAAQGVTVSHAEYEDGRGRCTVELSPETDVRRVADAVTHEYDGQVVAKRRRERELTTPQEFRDDLSDRLTDKQETALRTAFFADYFESPRGSTAEEVADTLDITGPTLLHHLRAGQKKLLAEFFETTDRE